MVDVKRIEKLATDFERLAADEKKSLKPSAKSRHRGTVAVDIDHPKNKSNEQHFPMNNANQARNALARVGAYTKAPSWWAGTLQELVSCVQRKVHKEFPGVEITKKKSK
jgi:hypothetical protein